MIDREQAHLIEVDGFFERFHEAEAEKTGVGPRTSDLSQPVLADVRGLRSEVAFLPNHVAIDLDVFDGAGDVALVGTDPVSDDAGAEHVGDEFVALAVPDEEGGAGAAAAVDFEVVLLLVAGDLDFVLQHSGGPEHAHDVGFFGLAEADGEIRRVLA